MVFSRAAGTANLRIYNFGSALVRYSEGLAIQDRLAKAVHKGAEDAVLLLQHPPVFTLGKRGRLEDVKVGSTELQRLGIEIASIPRGGEVTFHGPGQLVLYPILHLKRLQLGPRAYVEALEDVAIETAAEYNIHAEGRQQGRTGVWTQDRKLAAIGVKISQGVTTHGMALNVATDLAYFSLIVPCGILDKGVTSIERETGKNQEMSCVAEKLLSAFVKQFGYADQQQHDVVELLKA